MIARLQRLLNLLLILASLLLSFAAWKRGHGGLAITALLWAPATYASFLAFEFALMRRFRGADPSPKPSTAQIARAWWGELAMGPRVFSWRQPWCSERWPDHLPPQAAKRRGLLLVHGFFCNRGLWNPWMKRLRELGIAYVAIDLEPPFGSIDDYVEPIEQAMRRLEAATGCPPVVVAHSMGGLALRAWWARAGSEERIHRAVTIATPHHGTWLARWALTGNARQMRIASAWLRELERREPASRASRFVCFHGHCDNIVFPPAAAIMAGADNRHLAGVAHVCMTGRDEPWREVLHLLGP